MFEEAYQRGMNEVKLSELQMERLLEKMKTGTRSPLRRGLRMALTQALGSYAPYSQRIEGATVVANGVEIKVVSALADSAMVRVYVEARDLEGDRLNDRLGVWGTIDRKAPEDQRWSGNSYSGGGSLVRYDEETGTALLQFDSWGHNADGTGDARLVVLGLYPDGGIGGKSVGDDNWYVPLSIEKLSERVIPLTGEVWGAQLRQVSISPLGITVHTGGKQDIRSNYFAVRLDDGTFFHPQRGGGGSDGWIENPDPIRRSCFVFDDPALADRVTGVAFGQWFIPIDGETAGAGTWLKELPEQ